MSPRAGGEAAKFGERYEGRWTVGQLLRVLRGEATSLIVEDGRALSEGAEFTLYRLDGGVELHQVKRQPGMAASWSLVALRDVGVLSAAALHAEAGREFHFVSTIPATWLERLSDAARRSKTPKAFLRVHIEGTEARRELSTLEEIWGGTAAAWRVLRTVYVTWPPEEYLRMTNAALAAVYLRGADPALMAVGLGDLIWQNLGLDLDVPAVHERLGRYGMAPGTLVDQPTLGSAVAATRRRWLKTVADELLHPVIQRHEAAAIVQRLRDDTSAVVLVAGAAGAGKSAVLVQVVEALHDWPVLAMRVDRLGTFSTPRQLASSLDLPASPVHALGALASERPSLLVVDQLDAVSLASGRLIDELEPIVEMITEANAFRGMRVLLACRQFDLDHDPRLRALVGAPAALEKVGGLDDSQIDAAVDALKLDPAQLSTRQRELLALPLHLVLLAAVADEPSALGFGSTSDLLSAFYERKRHDCIRRREGVRFGGVVTTLAEAMSERAELSVPRSVLDIDDLDVDADLLASEGVIARDDQLVAFFHEAFFDYAFARAWVRRRQDLRTWLLGGEQELFCRAQVRQILVHLHDQEPARFRSDLRGCLSDPDIRFHVKATMIDVLSALAEPSAADWRLAMELRDGPLSDRIRGALRTDAWFQRADAEGALRLWLRGADDELRAVALEIMGAGAAAHGERVAELAGQLAGRDEYGRAVLWLIGFAGERPARALFERALDAVRVGGPAVTEDEIFMRFYRLPAHEPAWATELLAVWLAERPGAMAMDGQRIAALLSTHHGMLEMIDAAATGAPASFARLLVPYMVEVMRATATTTDDLPQPDEHFCWRDYAADDYQVDQRLISATGRAMRQVGEPDPILLAQPYDAAQWLAYQAFIGAGARHAAWAADVLAEAPQRLESGYFTNAYWTTRELLLAIGDHLDDDRLARVEEAVMGVADYGGFTLLSALPEERLSDDAREQLARLRESIGLAQPGLPPPTVSDVDVSSPVPEEDAMGLSDDAWLEAMARYAEDEHPHGQGGARELAQLLESFVKRDPPRFARLGLRLDDTYNPAYIVAVLRALADPEGSLAPAAAFDVVRHAARLSDAEIQRWLSWPLRRLAWEDVPDDIITLLLRIALCGESSSATLTRADLFSSGINGARGQSSATLALLLVTDVSGHRTRLIAGSLRDMAADPSLPVRACVAHLLTTAMRHARDEVLEAATVLLDADDALLAAWPAQELCLRLDDDAITERMLRSEREEVREIGGRHAAYTALERARPALLGTALGDVAARRGAVSVCAARLPFAGDAALAAKTIDEALNDPEPSVREAAAKVASALRDRALRPHAKLLLALIRSPTFDAALAQLTITLERATDRVDDLLGATVARFLERFGSESRSLSSAAAGHARQLGQLVQGWYAQADDPGARARAVDLLDEMLAADSLGVADIINEAER